MKQKIEIPEQEFATSIYNTKEWEESVVVKQYEHDYIKKVWIVTFEEK